MSKSDFELREPFRDFLTLFDILSSLDDLSQCRSILFNTRNYFFEFSRNNIFFQTFPSFRCKFKFIDSKNISDIGKSFLCFCDRLRDDLFDSSEPSGEFYLSFNLSRGERFVVSKSRGILFYHFN